ncbi:MAG: M61 family peptidase [Acidobacteria bacterium]|nr:M61 family peptidase [Acidobacteriota bacterium]
MLLKRVIVLCAAVVLGLTTFRAEEPIRYRFTFPEPQHRWMQVEATFADLDQAPLELRMSRASPGRYSLHDFAKNVYDVHAVEDGRELSMVRPDPYGWTVPRHGPRVTVTYKVYGDRVDGTYLAVDETHAHINMPAAIMWARGLDDRPATIAFERPPGTAWQVATQLHGDGSVSDARSPVPVFTAPNLQYLMDSPVEFGPIAVREFTVGQTRFRFAVHHTGSDADLESFVKDVGTIVRQEGAIYGEYPKYEPGVYTFLADYLPHARGDAMEHRNSAVLTSMTAIASDRAALLETVAHEFFHGWNVERIRPRSLEPFDFERANPSGELWLAEGFTQYYGGLVMKRAGLVDAESAAHTFGELVDAVVAGPGRLVRSAEDMSLMAPFTDGGQPRDRTNWSTTVISYYPFGGAIALALDLTLRDRSDGRVSLDDFMRAMWRAHGKPGGTREGYVDRPYTPADAEGALAEVSGDRAFARDFFARYVRGRDAADYARLLNSAGFALRKRNAGLAWLGDPGFDAGLRLASLVAPTWPIYAAGIDQDDRLERVDGQRVQSSSDVAAQMRRRKPGDRIEITFVDRTGRSKTANVTLAEDPHVDVVPLESTGGPLTPGQKQFRERWLGSKE